MMFRMLMISGSALAISACATTNDPDKMVREDNTAHHDKMAMEHGPHIIAVTSSQGFEETLAAAKSAINTRGFKTFAVIDHAAGAASIDQPLRPTTLIIFGNPKGGTPLMQANQLMGLQLPLKMLVSVNDKGVTEITYPDMAHTFHEYGLVNNEEALGKIDGALSAIAAEAGARP